MGWRHSKVNLLWKFSVHKGWRLVSLHFVALKFIQFCFPVSWHSSAANGFVKISKLNCVPRSTDVFSFDVFMRVQDVHIFVDNWYYKILLFSFCICLYKERTCSISVSYTVPIRIWCWLLYHFMIPILLITLKAIYGSSSSYIAELLLTLEPGPLAL